MATQAQPGPTGPRGSTRWDPDQYLKFADHRLRPALELLGRVPLTDPGVIYDLGCGAGEQTRMIAERWPDAAVYGVDSSREMLQKASEQPGRVQWIEADIRTWQPERQPNLLYSNATLQWVDGHRELFPRLVSLIAPGGCLAVQMPLSWGMPSHRIMRQTLVDGGPGGTPLGTEELRQRVDRKWVDDPVLEWVKGSGLRPILNDLSPSDRATYLAEYARRLREAYPLRANEKTLYPFRRLFIVATV